LIVEIVLTLQVIPTIRLREMVADIIQETFRIPPYEKGDATEVEVAKAVLRHLVIGGSAPNPRKRKPLENTKKRKETKKHTPRQNKLPDRTPKKLNAKCREVTERLYKLNPRCIACDKTNNLSK
jgi:hypothetical protein